MKRFNPEKELYKIQHGGRNKVIFGIFLLLIILGISSSYALYQVRYTKRIIYTKVAPFSTSDLDLAIYVDGTPDKLPIKGAAFVDKIECDNTNNIKIGWNYDKWALNIPNIEVPNKCKISFSTTKSLINYLKYNYELFDDETVDHNLRYIGKEPNNYIWYNCESYDNLTEDNAEDDTHKCEKWRIIGLMNNMTIVNETKKQSLVKIVRADSVGNMAWDSAGKNDWTTASLQSSLNGTYYNGTNLGSGKGITDATKNIIEEVTWNIGGWESYTSELVSQFYTYERESTTYNSQPSIWNGYIGLVYLSDYGYATSGGNMGRPSCLAYAITYWGTGTYKTDCAGNDWLYDSSNPQWTIMSNSSKSNRIFEISVTGGISGNTGSTYYASNHSHAIRPSLYLKSSVKLNAGDGSEDKPYILIP